MFYVTGDVHGDIKDLYSRKFGHLKKDDYMVLCGDTGLLWDGSKAEQKNLEKIGKKKYTTLLIDGAHENFDILAKYPVTDWNGGKAQVISGSLIHLMRGQVYTIAGKKVFTFGGGESSDREMRTPHVTWWEDEIPTKEEMIDGVNNLDAVDRNVDYVFTHEAPSGFRRFIDSGEYNLNALNVYLEAVREKTKFTKWIFGSYHVNRRISSQCETVFDGVIKLD